MLPLSSFDGCAITLLSIDQAAARLGKTARQIRYMIQYELLPAEKVAGRWLIKSEDLPLSPPQQQAVARKERQLRTAVEEGLGLTGDERPENRYSIRDLKAFQIALPLYRQTNEALGSEHPATHTPSPERLSRGLQAYRGLLLSL